jgi:glycine cleavage system H protein
MRSGFAARFALPADRHYLIARHVWARPDDGLVTVGVAAPLREVLYATPEVDVWAVDRVEAGGPLLTVQGRDGRTVVVSSPIAGSVIEINPLLARATHTLLTQPYSRGWVARLDPDNWERDVASMKLASQYRSAVEVDLIAGREACFDRVMLPRIAA